MFWIGLYFFVYFGLNFLVISMLTVFCCWWKWKLLKSLEICSLSFLLFAFFHDFFWLGRTQGKSIFSNVCFLYNARWMGAEIAFTYEIANGFGFWRTVSSFKGMFWSEDISSDRIKLSVVTVLERCWFSVEEDK